MTAPKLAQDALARFEVARAELYSFQTAHHDIIETYKALLGAAEDAMENCKKQYRIHHEKIGSSFGGFTAIHKTAIDADALIRLIGLDRAKAIHILKTEYSVIRDQFDRAVGAGELQWDVVAEVEVKSVSIKTPKL